MEYDNKKCCSQGCSFLSIIISVVIGAAVGIIFSFGLIPITLNLIIIALITSVIALGVLWGTLFLANLLKGCNNFGACICKTANCLLIGSIGTLLSGTVAAIVGVTGTTALVSAIFVGLTALFFVLTIIQIISLFLCIIKKTCN